VREVSGVQFIGFVWTGTQLVSAGRADVANNLPEVEVVGDEFVGERLEQFRVGSRVRDADIVDGFDNASTDVLCPHEVGHVFGEPRVIFRTDPISEELATVGVFALGRFTSEEFWGNNDITDRVFGFAGATVVNDAFPRVFAVFASNLGEERDEAAIVFHGPPVERMVVALGALDSDSEECLGSVFCVFEGVWLGEEEVGRWILKVRAIGAEKARCDFVEWKIVVELLFDPRVVGDDGFVVHLPLLIGRDLEEFTPFEGPYVNELMTGDEAVDEFFAFGGIFIVHELFHLLTGGEDAVDVDEGATG
jgi:hypothetical protein